MNIQHRMVLCSPTPNGLIYDFASANSIIEQVANGKCVMYKKGVLRKNGEIPLKEVSGAITNAWIKNNELVFDITVYPGEFKNLIEYWATRNQEIPYSLTTEVIADIDIDNDQVQAENLTFLGVSWFPTKTQNF